MTNTHTHVVTACIISLWKSNVLKIRQNQLKNQVLFREDKLSYLHFWERINHYRQIRAVFPFGCLSLIMVFQYESYLK